MQTAPKTQTCWVDLARLGAWELWDISPVKMSHKWAGPMLADLWDKNTHDCPRLVDLADLAELPAAAWG
jgi:hypothetical protein